MVKLETIGNYLKLSETIGNYWKLKEFLEAPHILVRDAP